MAVILDSRYKMMLINYYYLKIYVVGLKNQLKRVRELCDEMMNYYEVKSATTRYNVAGESFTSIVFLSDQSLLILMILMIWVILMHMQPK